MSGGAGVELPVEDPWAPPAPRDVLPAGLATMPPGAELGALLEGIDRDELNGYELVEVLKAQARQISHLQAGFYANIVEMAHTLWGDADSEAERMPIPDEMAIHELRPALGITRRAAELHFEVAFSLARLPQVLEALERGVIDLSRAKVLCTETEHLTVEEAHHIVNEISGDAARLTTGQLGARLRKRCLEYDPDSARRRYHRGLEDRRVEGGQNPDGTADLLARRLPTERVAAILARLTAQAKRLRGKDDRTMDQIRADLLLDLLEGNSHGEAHQQRGGVEIRVDLTTLLHLDEHAADIPGWGPIIADIARRILRDRHRARGEIVVTDPDTGQPIHTQTARRFPTAAQTRHIVARDQRCVFPGCRVPARVSQIDHTHPHHLGGPTQEENLGPLCNGDHQPLKHEGGWTLTQPQPGHFHWTSPRGHTYQVGPDPP